MDFQIYVFDLQLLISLKIFLTPVANCSLGNIIEALNRNTSIWFSSTDTHRV
jgi:hypothetical protein